MLVDQKKKSDIIKTFKQKILKSSLAYNQIKYDMSYLYLYESILVDSFLFIDNPLKV